MTTMTGFCERCGAVEISCCESARRRGEMADSLAVLVKRQSDYITRLQRELAEARALTNCNHSE
ncbi:MAG: hypothetical protein KGL39_25845 [Patescibacteria group bacterium]|nr:hypothetical protein [Patescibacteria group bacterium]